MVIEEPQRTKEVTELAKTGRTREGTDGTLRQCERRNNPGPLSCRGVGHTSWPHRWGVLLVHLDLTASFVRVNRSGTRGAVGNGRRLPLG